MSLKLHSPVELKELHSRVELKEQHSVAGLVL